MNGRRLNNLRFADDIAVISDLAEDLSTMLSDLYQESKKKAFIQLQQNTHSERTGLDKWHESTRLKAKTSNMNKK